jgi:hypothetical protein
MGKASRRKAVARTTALLRTTQSRLQELGASPGIQVRLDLPEAEKISNAISAILHSEADEDCSLDDYRERANAIVLAWNACLMSTEQQADVFRGLAEFVEKTNPFGTPAAQAELRRLMEKKQAMFPDDRRFIVSHEVEFVGSKVHVTAAALSAPQQHPAAE